MSLGEESGFDTTLSNPGYLLIDRFAWGELSLTGSDVDHYQVTLDPGRYFFYVGGSSFLGTPGAANISVDIYNIDGMYVDTFGGTTSGGMFFTVSEQTTFVWDVSSSNPFGGGYALRVRHPDAVDDVHGDNIYAGAPTLGVTYKLELEFASDVDTLRVDLEGGFRYFFAIESVDIPDIYITVENSGYETLAFSDIAYGTAEFYMPDYDQTLFLTISSDSYVNTGHYNFFYQATMTSNLPVEIGTPLADKLSASRASELWGWDGTDKLLGSSGADYLLGGRGADRLSGYAGNDKLYGENGGDVISGGKGADAILGGAGADLLSGNKGNDRIVGGAGGDRLEGGMGRDVLAGGGGADVVVFRAAKETRPGAQHDVINDFDPLRDTIDLSGIDAKVGRVGDQAFKFIGAAAFSDKAGELRYKKGILSGDVDGDGVADLQIELSGAPMLQAADILL
jgi:serralysin